MRRRLRLLMVMVSVVILVSALNLGVASADGGHYDGGAETDGINSAADAGAYAPVGSGAGGDNAKGFDESDGAAIDGITNNPLCPLNPGNAH